MTATKAQQKRTPRAPLPPATDGILLVDKPGGKTSHDIVNLVRYRLGTKQVGHAGTLDPMATGLLVVLIGTATRLASFATGAEKSYAARVCLGATTDSLDADGTITATAPVSGALRDDLRTLASRITAALEATGAAAAATRSTAPTTATAISEDTATRVDVPASIESALRIERERTEQVPPVVSAIHVDGQRSYDLARRGETPELAARVVSVIALTIVGADGDADLPWIDVEITVSKGYYVRSLARDLGASLGVPAHLTALRRLSSGSFLVREAIVDPEKFGESVVPLRTAIDRLMPSIEITDEGALRARQGKSLAEEHFVGVSVSDVPAAWLLDGVPVAVGQMNAGVARVIRGFPS